jgi:hypothetical protein
VDVAIMISFDSRFPSQVLSAARLEATVARFQDIFPVQAMVKAKEKGGDTPPVPGQATPEAEGESPNEAPKAALPSSPPGVDGSSMELSAEERELVRELSMRDQQVRAHEMAHVATGSGIVTSGASYQYASGPDGKRYAIGGEVSIDTSPGKTPEETLAKAQRIRAAAMAPADPSPQDISVASFADQMAAAARAELASRQMAEVTGDPQENAEDQALQPAKSPLPPEDADPLSPLASPIRATESGPTETGPDFIPGDDIAKALFGIPITEKQPKEDTPATSPIPGIMERRQRTGEMRPYPEFEERVKGKTIDDIRIEQKSVIQFREIPGFLSERNTGRTVSGENQIGFEPTRKRQITVPTESTESRLGKFRRVIAAYFDSRLAVLPDPRGGRVNLWA